MSERTNRITKEEYLQWLGAQLRDEHANPNKTYWDLTIAMYAQPFSVTKVPMDDNRVADGMDLRVDFARLESIPSTRMPVLGPCSFLEVLIALSRRMAFAAGGQAPGWAWQFLCNLELDRMSDPFTRTKDRKTQEIMETVIWRSYSPDGRGGFFPLQRPDDDQTRLELWYQMHAYIEELHQEH